MRYLKTPIAALFVAAVAVLGLGAAAQASTTTGRSCSSGGTTTTVHLSYTSPGGIVEFDSFAWSTSPAAQLNRISIAARHPGGNEVLMGAAGGTSTTLNDVGSSDSYYQPSDWPKSVGTSGAIEWRASIWGGVGNSTDSCNTGWHAL